ncbi:type II toxin-antitoxin system VapC family toxin [Mycolicibacter longobardus]|uniref:type II toxin-antitoxin system VapC family toxin n=1 Tax=Mycolicibacter longobardus TaxID=1108812 RepID=UPI0021F354D1|nr:type II toxin-antitoxin system VapC family toxin [Mycolicibacter longobardus]MCV7383820.1 type II toxin-antitoxin system VapC family toxin [Mycolicibacter longobardus]
MGVTHLLATHALLWALTDPARLGPNAREVLTDRSVPIFVSSVSAWELATKQRLGKLPQADAVLGAYSRHLDRLGATRLPMDEEHALLAGRLDWDHRDPFDRMLAAQAIIHSMTLITGDAAFAGLAGLRTLW